MTTPKIKVGILGCTGTVGQKFIQLLEGHPFFQITSLGASDASSGQTYLELMKGRWKQVTDIPRDVHSILVTSCDPRNFDCDLVFSALDASVAGTIEEEFASKGFPVFSNAKNHRMDEDVPILIPSVNSEHIHIVEKQRKNRKYDRGFIVTNANCASTGLVVVLKPLLDKFGIKRCICTTMQAISGAGYPGVPSLDIMDNVIPYISGEEHKLETEPRKILGKLTNDGFVDASFTLSASCNRVPVIDGHVACISVELEQKASVEEVVHTLKSFNPSIQNQLHSFQNMPPIRVLEQQDRPQPRLDRNYGNGYVVTVGGIRKCPIFDIKMNLLSHNTVIGAAGGSILNAELAYLHGLLK